MLTLVKLFFTFFQVGLFGVGGGYATLPLIQSQIVDMHQWLTMGQFTDIITISQMTPGPIAINTATFVGIQVSGYVGAVVATVGNVLPSMIIVITLGYFYFKYREFSIIKNVLTGIRPAVVALIASAGLSMVFMAIYASQTIPKNPLSIDVEALILFLISLFLLRKYKLNPIIVMCATGFVGAVLHFAV